MAKLLECLFACDLERLKILLGPTGINSPIPGFDGCTPLHVIAGLDTLNSKEHVLDFLLENGADPNARTYENLTPVHIAAMWNKCYELEKLLQHGGNPWLTDIDNKNSFDMAADNYCHEAYRLLNIYLSEDKLNFIPERKMSKELPVSSTTLNCTKIFLDAESEGRNTSINHTFMTANENFPLIFSTDDSEDYSSDVSRFLKRKNLSKHTTSKVFSEENNVPDTPLTKQNECTDKKNTNIQVGDVKDRKKSCGNQLNKAYIFSSSDCDSSDIVTTDLNDSIDSNYSTIIDSDNYSGIVLVEMRNNNNSCSSSVTTCDLGNDWKSYRNTDSNCSTLTYCSSHSKISLVIPNDLQEYSNSKIFQELKDLGDDPGPVLDHTRQVYLHRLTQMKSGCIISCGLPKPKYCPEVYLFLENKMDMDKALFLEKNMAQQFDVQSEIKWREGSQRSCFNYFLLDPRVTQNLPQRASDLSNEQSFLIFLDAIFYVGKGTGVRPYSHLFEAAKSVEGSRPKSDKVSHILDIWNSGLGVISLHCFHHAIPVEAYTREACIIEAVGLENLTNIKKGDFYGLCAKLTSSRKRLIGISLLKRALQIYMSEGETLIKPQNVLKSHS